MSPECDNIVTCPKTIMYPCDRCDYKAKKKHQVHLHIKSMHVGEKYQCNECDYKATRKYHLQRHIKIVHTGFTYQHQYLNRHKDSIHDENNF